MDGRPYGGCAFLRHLDSRPSRPAWILPLHRPTPWLHPTRPPPPHGTRPWSPPRPLASSSSPSGSPQRQTAKEPCGESLSPRCSLADPGSGLACSSSLRPRPCVRLLAPGLSHRSPLPPNATHPQSQRRPHPFPASREVPTSPRLGRVCPGLPHSHGSVLGFPTHTVQCWSQLLIWSSSPDRSRVGTDAWPFLENLYEF